MPSPREDSPARKDMSIAQLTATADLILVELHGVIGEMAGMLRKGASS